VSAGDFVIVRLGSQDFGISVAEVRDVLQQQTITPVPLAPHAVAGLLNLRGRVVTAIDLRLRLGLLSRAADVDSANVVVERDGEFYALVVDAVGDVVTVAQDRLEAVPARLDPQWREVAAAVYPAAGGLIVLLDIARLLDFVPRLRAAC
jgi:purine-binding chemotaxis protein CheW